MSFRHSQVSAEHKRNLEYSNELQKAANSIKAKISIHSILTYLDLLIGAVEGVKNQKTEITSETNNQIAGIIRQIHTLTEDAITLDQTKQAPGFSAKLLSKHFRKNPGILESIQEEFRHETTKQNILEELQNLLKYEQADEDTRIMIIYCLKLLKERHNLDFTEIKDLPIDAIKTLKAISVIGFDDLSAFHKANIENSYQLTLDILNRCPQYIEQSEVMDSFVQENLGDDPSMKPQKLSTTNEISEQTIDTPPPNFPSHLRLLSSLSEPSTPTIEEISEVKAQRNPFSNQHTEATRLVNQGIFKGSIRRTPQPTIPSDENSQNTSRKKIKSPEELLDSKV